MIEWAALLPSIGAVDASGDAGMEDEPKPHGEAEAGIRERGVDNRRRCTECGNLNDRGLCLAAYRGEIVASRSYTPIRDMLHRCEGFIPLSDDPDQRIGRDRWGQL